MTTGFEEHYLLSIPDIIDTLYSVLEKSPANTQMYILRLLAHLSLNIGKESHSGSALDGGQA